MVLAHKRLTSLYRSTGVLFCFLFFVAGCPYSTAQTPPSANPSRPFAPDACGPIDPAYIHVANETGGQPMFFQRSEVAKSFHAVRESTRNNMAKIFWGTGALSGKPESIEIPVDSVTARVTFSLSVDTKGGTFKLTQPSGGIIAESMASTEITEWNCGRIVTVSSPEPGNWRVEISGTGRYWFEAQAQSEIFFVTAEFVKQGGRPGHEGLFKISGQPLAGAPATLLVRLSSKQTKSSEFDLVSERGKPIESVNLHTAEADPEDREFVGTIELPDQPFRVAVMGLDSNGKAFQRFFSNLFHAETLEVAPRQLEEDLQAGKTVPITFAIRNLGAPSAFKITVTDARRFVSSSVPQELNLGNGESGILRVELTVPSDVAPGTGDDLVVVATRTAPPASSNSGIVHLSVVSHGAH